MVVAVSGTDFWKKKRPQFNTEAKLTKFTDGVITQYI
jgi:hypothetical protein